MEIQITTPKGVEVINTDQIAFLNSDGGTGSILDIYQGSGATQPLAIEESPADIITATSNLFFQVTLVPTPLIIKASIPYIGSGFSAGQEIVSGKKTSAIIQSDSGSALSVYNYNGIALVTGNVIQSSTGSGTLSGDATYTYPNNYTTYINISKCFALNYSGVAGLNSLQYQSSLLNTSPLLTTLTAAQLLAAQAAAVGGGSYWTQSGGNLYPTTLTDNVGIGTSSPTAKLHVVGTFTQDTTSGTDTLNINADASGTSIAITDTGVYESAIILFPASGGNPSYSGIKSANSSAGESIFIIAQEGRAFIGDNDTGGNEFLTVQQNGNIGMGVANPTRKLEVIGTALLTEIDDGTTPALRLQSNKLYLSGEGNPLLGNASGWTIQTDRNVLRGFSDTSLDIARFSQYDGTQKVVIDGAGNVGIGTATPDGALNVETGGLTFLATDSFPAAGNTEQILSYIIDNDVAVSNGLGAGFTGYNAYIQARDLANGVHAIVQAHQDVEIHAYYTFDSSNPGSDSQGIFISDFGIEVRGNTSGRAIPIMAWLLGNGSEAARISDTGNLGIGTTAPTEKLTVADGNIEVSTVGNGIILPSPNGNKWLLTISDLGVPVVTVIP